MTVKIDYTLYRPYVLVGGEEFLNYLLVNIIPESGEGGGAAPIMPMAMVPVIDVSGSMYAEERLDTVQRAAHHLIDQLRPTDTLALVAFADRSQVAAPLTQGSNASLLHRAVDSVPELNVGGSTALARGFKDALDLLQQPAYQAYARRILLLTDGNTGDEQECLQLAHAAQAQEIVVSVIGVGFGLERGIPDATRRHRRRRLDLHPHAGQRQRSRLRFGGRADQAVLCTGA